MGSSPTRPTFELSLVTTELPGRPGKTGVMWCPDAAGVSVASGRCVVLAGAASPAFVVIGGELVIPHGSIVTASAKLSAEVRPEILQKTYPSRGLQASARLEM